MVKTVYANKSECKEPVVQKNPPYRGRIFENYLSKQSSYFVAEPKNMIGSLVDYSLIDHDRESVALKSESVSLIF